MIEENYSSVMGHLISTATGMLGGSVVERLPLSAFDSGVIPNPGILSHIRLSAWSLLLLLPVSLPLSLSFSLCLS